jgi:hypothetical protein
MFSFNPNPSTPEHLLRPNPYKTPILTPNEANPLYIPSYTPSPSHICQLQPRHNVHTLQLLKQQLASIRDLDAGHVFRASIQRRHRAAPVGVIVAQQTALGAHVDFELIRADHKALQKQHAGTVSNEAIALHLTCRAQQIGMSLHKHKKRNDNKNVKYEIE